MRRVSVETTAAICDEDENKANIDRPAGQGIAHCSIQQKHQAQLATQQTQYKDRRLGYQINALLRQKKKLERQTKAFHELKELISFEKEKKIELIQMHDDLKVQFAEEDTIVQGISSEIDTLKSSIKKLENDQNIVQSLKTMITRDQQHFTMRELRHEEILAQYQVQEENNKQLENEIKNMEQKIDEILKTKPLLDPSGSNLTRKERQVIVQHQIQEKNELKDEIARLKAELAHHLNEDKLRVRQMKQFNFLK